MTEAYTRADVQHGVLDEVAGGNVENIGLSSAVTLSNGEVRHLTFLDFHCEINDPNTDIVYRVCRRLLPAGFVVLDSGDSYHATSLCMGTGDDRVRVLGKALLLAPIVDATYIAHQLQQDEISIRISKGGKCKKFPVAIDIYIPARDSRRQG